MSPQAQDQAQSLVQSVDWLAIAPPTIAAVVALAVLVADLFVDGRKKALLGWVSVAGLALAALALLPLLDGDRSTFCLTGDADVCSYTADRFTLVIQFLVLGGALLAALLSMTTLKDANKEAGKDADTNAGKDADRALPEGEFWFLLLSSAMRRRPAARLARSRHPDRRPGGRLPARLRPRRHQAR